MARAKEWLAEAARKWRAEVDAALRWRDPPPRARERLEMVKAAGLATARRPCHLERAHAADREALAGAFRRVAVEALAMRRARGDRCGRTRPT